MQLVFATRQPPAKWADTCLENPADSPRHGDCSGCILPRNRPDSRREREENTQTLLSAPISHESILTGKFVAVSAITIASGLTNLGTIALLFGQSGFQEQLPDEIALSLSPELRRW